MLKGGNFSVASASKERKSRPVRGNLSEKTNKNKQKSSAALKQKVAEA